MHGACQHGRGAVRCFEHVVCMSAGGCWHLLCNAAWRVTDSDQGTHASSNLAKGVCVQVAGDQGVVWQLRTYNVLVPSLFAALPPSSGAAPPPQALSAATYHTLSSVGLCVARRSGQDAGEGGDTQRCVLGALRIGDAPATDPRVADLRVTATHVCDAAAEASATTEAVASADSDLAGVAATDDTPEHNGNNRGEQALSLLLQWHDDGACPPHSVRERGSMQSPKCVSTGPAALHRGVGACR